MKPCTSRTSLVVKPGMYWGIKICKVHFLPTFTTHLLQQQVETVLSGDPHMNLITLPAFSGIYDFCFLIQIEPNTKKPDILPIPSEISRENAGAKVFCGKTFFN